MSQNGRYRAVIILLIILFGVGGGGGDFKWVTSGGKSVGYHGPC